MAQFKIIATLDCKMGISKNGKKPWCFSEEENFFKNIVTTTESKNLKNALIMDMEKWREFSKKFSNKKGDYNNVILVIIDNVKREAKKATNKKHQKAKKENLYFESLQDALDELENRNDLDKLFVIGGAKLFEKAVLHPDLNEIHITHIQDDFDCDTFFPKEIPETFQVASTSDIIESEGLEYSQIVLTNEDDNFNDLNNLITENY